MLVDALASGSEVDRLELVRAHLRAAASDPGSNEAMARLATLLFLLETLSVAQALLPSTEASPLSSTNYDFWRSYIDEMARLPSSQTR